MIYYRKLRLGGNNMIYDILYVVGGLLVGLIAGFFIAKKVFKKQLLYPKLFTTTLSDFSKRTI